MSSAMITKLFSMSISAGLLILCLITIRLLLSSRLPRQWFVLAGLIVLLRLLVPFDLPFSTGFSLPVPQFLSSGDTFPADSTGSDGGLTSSNYTGGRLNPIGNSIPTVAPSLNGPSTAAAPGSGLPRPGKETLILLIWISGACLGLALFLWQYLRESRLLRQSLPFGRKSFPLLGGRKRNIPLRVSDRITTPVSFGFFHSSIILPKEMTREGSLMQDAILYHEWIHIRRHDNLFKLFAIAAACIHWFNPLVWIWLFLFEQDLELSCDEAVVAGLTPDQKESYALTLISFAGQKRGILSPSSSFGKNAVKERIVAIMNYKKKGTASLFLGAALLCASLTVFAQGTSTDQAASSQNETATGHSSKKVTSDEQNTETAPAHSASETADASEDTITDETETEVYLFEDTFDADGLSIWYGTNGQSISYIFQPPALTDDEQAMTVSLGGSWLEEYLPYGLSRDEETDSWMYNSQTINILLDEDGMLYSNPNGVLYLYITRDDDNVIDTIRILTAEEVSSHLASMILGRTLTDDTTGNDSAAADSGKETDSESESEQDAAAISIIGGADGPTSVFIAGKIKE